MALQQLEPQLLLAQQMEGQIRRILVKDREIEIEILQRRREIIGIFPEYYEFVLKIYGLYYPFVSPESFATMGPESRIITIREQGELIAFLAYMHDEENDRIEYGRLMVSPNHPFNVLHLKPEIDYLQPHNHSTNMWWAATRVWIVSVLAQLYNLRLCGSWIYPKPMSSPWYPGPSYNYGGVYCYVPPQRLSHTMQVPKWVFTSLPQWQPVFSMFKGRKGTRKTPLNSRHEDFDPLNACVPFCEGKSVLLPCIPNDSIKQEFKTLLNEGYTCMAFLPSWQKASLDTADETYCSWLLLEKKTGYFSHCNYPTRFKLSPQHYEFTKIYQCNTEEIHYFYQKPLRELFIKRKLPSSLQNLLNSKMFDNEE